VLREAAGFFAGRLLTLGFETAVLAVFVTWLGLPEMPVKILATIGVLVLNYLISKLFVFRKNEEEEENGSSKR